MSEGVVNLSDLVAPKDQKDIRDQSYIKKEEHTFFDFYERLFGPLCPFGSLSLRLHLIQNFMS